MQPGSRYHSSRNQIRPLNLPATAGNYYHTTTAQGKFPVHFLGQGGHSVTLPPQNFGLHADVLSAFRCVRRFPVLLLFVLALVALISESWLAEDAAITLRAVENLYHTFGPVYNPGENTEVYTHPLWFSVLVILRGTGLDLPLAAVLGGMVLALVGLALMVLPPRNPDKVYEPPFKLLYLIIPFLLIAHPGFRQFAASGMELGLLFLLLGLFYLMLENHSPAQRPGLLGLYLGLLYLTRPELGLFAVWYGAFFLWELLRQKHLGKRARLARALKAATAILMVAGSWHLFRFLYYGELFPNTYYAKAGLGSYWIQGLKYFAHSIVFGPGAWILLLMAVAYAYLTYFHSPTLQEPKDRSAQWFRLARDAGAPVLMALYVIRLGGDFMAFRFLLPELIMVAWLARRLFTMPLPNRWNGVLSSWDNRTIQTALAMAALAVITLLLPVPAAKGYIANERFHFVSKFESKGLSLFDPVSHPWGKRGQELSQLQSCLNYRPFRIANSQAEAYCMEGMGLGYVGLAAGPYVQIVDEQGISDSYVARLPILLRFRPGHEHSIGTLEVLAKDVLFCQTGDLRYDEIMSTRFGTVVRWDPDLLMTIPDIEDRLRMLRDQKASGSPAIHMLEQRYGVTVEELLEKSRTWPTPLTEQKTRCWQ